MSEVLNFQSLQEVLLQSFWINSFVLGGGFGGKETRNIAFTVPIAVAAAKYVLTILCILAILCM